MTVITISKVVKTKIDIEKTVEEAEYNLGSYGNVPYDIGHDLIDIINHLINENAKLQKIADNMNLGDILNSMLPNVPKEGRQPNEYYKFAMIKALRETDGGKNFGLAQSKNIIEYIIDANEDAIKANECNNV